MQLHLTACLRFASLTQMPSALRKHAEREAYWPDRAEMKWFNSNPKWKQLPLSA